MITKEFSYKSSPVFYNIYGEGKPLVLLHGFAENGTVWHYQVKYLQNNFKVIVPDLPGYGASAELNLNPVEMLVDDYANCIYHLLLSENITNCTIIGHSMGGYITLAIADKHPELLKAFGFVHSTAFADSDEKKEQRLKGIQAIEDYGGYAFIKNTIPGLFSIDFKRKKPTEIQQLIDDAKTVSNKTLQQSYYAMMKRPDRTHVLSRTALPVLFIAGEEDVAVPLSDILKQLPKPEISYFHILRKVLHMGMMEQPDLVNKYLEEFVNDVA